MKWIVPFSKYEESRLQPVKWGLVLSSTTFAIPIVYMFLKKTRFWYLIISYGTTCIVSMNYWRNPVSGFRRNVDICVARGCFLTTCLSGAIYVREPFLFVIGLPLVILIPLFYGLSIYFFQLKNDHTWAFMHMSMHAFVSLGMTIVAAGAIQSNVL